MFGGEVVRAGIAVFCGAGGELLSSIKAILTRKVHDANLHLTSVFIFAIQLRVLKQACISKQISSSHA